MNTGDRPTSKSSPIALSILIVALLVPPGINLLQYWLHNPLYGYGLWVPLLAGYLIWQRRPPSDAVPAHPLPLATLILLACYFAAVPPLRVVQIANPDWRLLDWLLAGG